MMDIDVQIRTQITLVIGGRETASMYHVLDCETCRQAPLKMFGNLDTILKSIGFEEQQESNVTGDAPEKGK